MERPDSHLPAMMLDVRMSLGFDLSLNVRCPLMKPAFDMAGVVSGKNEGGGCSDELRVLV
jgi:hypothetical protein